MTSKKNKSDMRWEQGRRLYEAVTSTLPTPSHVTVLMFCWFHAQGPQCEFNAAYCQIAESTTLSYERVRKIMCDLVDGGVIKTIEGSAGRGYAPKRIITGKPYTKKVVTHDHLKRKKVVASDLKGGHQ